MRISDWSSDVCSSDLIADFLAQPGAPEFLPQVDFTYSVTDEDGAVATAPVVITLPEPTPPRTALGTEQGGCLNEDTEGTLLFSAHPTDGASKIGQIRSEEHTSELQSLMRNSQAVFCLKEKKITVTYK